MHEPARQLITLYQHMPDGMRQDAEDVLVGVRPLFPQVTFEIGVDQVFLGKKRNPDEPPPPLTVYAGVPRDVPDLTLVSYLFEVMVDRYHWREHAKALKRLLHTVNRACYEAAADRDYLMAKWTESDAERDENIARVEDQIDHITESIKEVLVAAKSGNVERLREIASELGASAVLPEPVDVVGDPPVAGLVAPGTVLAATGEHEAPNDG